MRTSNVPALWLLITVIILPQLSETIYSPSLPDIARSLATSESMVEYTLTIYLFGFAIGTLFWGKLSDQLGRKPCLVMGMTVYTLGCICCFFSNSIAFLMMSRLIQAFGGSTGSVLGQSICRDAFPRKERAKVFSVIGAALSFSPAIGPIIGGSIDQQFGWPAIFLLLTALGCIVCFCVQLKLCETLNITQQKKTDTFNIALNLIKNPKVIIFGFLIAGCNGIPFSYYAEGSFYLIEILGLTPTFYGLTFLGIALALAVGSGISRKMQNHLHPTQIIMKGLKTVAGGSFIFLATTLTLQSFHTPKFILITITLSMMIVIMTGIGMIIPNALSVALEDYKNSIGTASALFGFSYYVLISLVTLGMGLLHNGTLIPMPLYFFGISMFMWVSFARWLPSYKA